LFAGSQEAAYKWTTLHKDKPIILIMGGSIGSLKINYVIRENLDHLLEKYQIIHICGTGNIDENIHVEGYRQYEYVNEELKDILALHIPMLLIPLPLSASRGDKIDNAKSFVNSGFAHMLMEEDITTESFERAIEKLITNGADIQARMKQEDMQASREKVIKLIE